jgi:ribosomal protein S18 acetylase RimI-like enzyme
MIIRQMTSQEKFNSLEIAASLPHWFTSKGLELLRKDIALQLSIVAVEQDQVVGFLTYFVDQGTATIGWMGVHPEQHRKGVGSFLLKELFDLLKADKVSKVFVSTLGDSVDYAPYNQTRSFYRKNGFNNFKIIKHPDNPEQEEELILYAEI